MFKCLLQKTTTIKFVSTEIYLWVFYFFWKPELTKETKKFQVTKLQTTKSPVRILEGKSEDVYSKSLNMI